MNHRSSFIKACRYYKKNDMEKLEIILLNEKIEEVRIKNQILQNILEDQETLKKNRCSHGSYGKANWVNVQEHQETSKISYLTNVYGCPKVLEIKD